MTFSHDDLFTTTMITFTTMTLQISTATTEAQESFICYENWALYRFVSARDHTNPEPIFGSKTTKSSKHDCKMIHSDDSETESEYFEESDDDAPPCGLVADTRDAVVYDHAACSSVAAPEAAQQPPTSANSSTINTNNTTRATALSQTQPPQTTQFKHEQHLASSSPVPTQAFVSPFASLALPTGFHSAPIATVKTESIATDLVSGPPSQEREYCAQCKAPLCSESSYSASASTSMCLCCKRPVVVSRLFPSERNRRIIWRCPECASPPRGRSEEVLSQLLAALPERIQDSGAIFKALSAITAKMKKFHKTHPPNTSPALRQLEKDIRKQKKEHRVQLITREQAIQHGTTTRDEVFAKWLQIRGQLLELAVKKTVLCRELLSSVSQELPKKATERYLGETGTPHPAPLEETVRCGGCIASLLPTPAVSESSPAFCDCCKRMVPLILMAETPFEKTSALCSVCDNARGSTTRPDDQLQHQQSAPLLNDRVDAKWIQDLTSIAASLKSTESSSNGLGTETTDIAILAEIKKWRKKARALRKRLCDAIHKGSASVSTSRQLYADQVAVDQGLQQAFEKLIIARVERMAELKTRLPLHKATVVCRVYADQGLQVPVGLFEEETPPPPLVQCKGCHEQLTPTPKAKGSIGFCDCCQCVLPMASIAKISDDTCVSICQTCCKTRSLESLCRDNRLKKRLPSQQIHCLLQVITLLRRPLLAVESSRPQTIPDTQRLSAEQELQNYTTKLKETKTRMDNAVKKGHPPVVDVKRSRQLYADHMKASEASVQSALDLVQILLEATAFHEMEIPPEAKALLAKQQIALKEAPEVKRSGARKRNANSDTLLAHRSSQKRPRLADDCEREPGEISE